jgi:hypothetical protein
MVTRTKERFLGSYSGTKTTSTGGTVQGESPGTSGPWPLKRETMTDNVSPGDMHSFSVERSEFVSSSPVFNAKKLGGTYPPGTAWCEAKDWPFTLGRLDSSTYNVNSSHLSVSQASDSVLTTKLIARTNPSRSVVDMPIFLAELREIPQLINIAGKTILRTTAKANLSYQFGWKPLIGDLMSLLNFHDIAHSRYLEIKELYSGGLRRTIKLESDSNSSTTAPNTLLANFSTDVTIRLATVNRTTRYNAWGHARWKPTSVPPRGDQAMRNQAMRAVLGLTIDPQTFWELIPFSWLADYFGTIGDYLQASRNIIPAVCTNTAIMRDRVTDSRWNIQCNNGASPPARMVILSSEAKHVRRTNRSRTPTSPTPSIEADLSWLTPRQWGILLSLFILRGGSSISHR